MTPEQCAEFLGIKINTLYVMKSQGRIPYRKVGHLLRFDFDEIVEWTKDKRSDFDRTASSGTIRSQPLWLQPPNGGDVL
jgi:excisionase family DNA binding protein